MPSELMNDAVNECVREETEVESTGNGKTGRSSSGLPDSRPAALPAPLRPVRT